MLRVNRAGRRPDASAAGAVVIGTVIGLVIGSPLWPAAGAGFVNWPGYLHDPAHTSMSQATAITTSSVAGLHAAWRFVPEWRAQNLSAGPAWTIHVGQPGTPAGVDMCLAAAVWDAAGGRLLQASNNTKIGGRAYPASVRRLNPATGSPIWQVGLGTGPVLGTTALDSHAFSQPVFADRYLFVGTGRSLTAWAA